MDIFPSIMFINDQHGPGNDMNAKKLLFNYKSHQDIRTSCHPDNQVCIDLPKDTIYKMGNVSLLQICKIAKPFKFNFRFVSRRSNS